MCKGIISYIMLYLCAKTHWTALYHLRYDYRTRIIKPTHKSYPMGKSHTHTPTHMTMPPKIPRLPKWRKSSLSKGPSFHAAQGHGVIAEKHMGVSWNGGTPKSMVNGKCHYINWMIWGYETTTWISRASLQEGVVARSQVFISFPLLTPRQ